MITYSITHSGFDQFSDGVEQGPLELVNRSVCANIFRGVPGYDPDTMFCAGDVENGGVGGCSYVSYYLILTED